MGTKKIIYFLLLLSFLTSKAMDPSRNAPDIFTTSCLYCQQEFSSAKKIEFEQDEEQVLSERKKLDIQHKEHVLNCKEICSASKDDAWRMAQLYTIILGTDSDNSYWTASNNFAKVNLITKNSPSKTVINLLQCKTKVSIEFWHQLQEDHKKSPLLVEHVLRYYDFIGIDYFYNDFYIDTENILHNSIIDFNLNMFYSPYFDSSNTQPHKKQKIKKI